MRSWLLALDGILRGDATRLPRLREGRLDIPAGGLTLLLVALAASYGFCMGWFALFNREEPTYLQVVATMVKVPALFFLTLLVTFPSLYVFNALVGSRLTVPVLFRLLVTALAVTIAVLSSFGPIVAFFSVTTTNYPFMVLLNVVLFTIAGVLGLSILLQTLHRLSLPAPPVPTPEPDPASALDRVEGSVLGRNVKAVFACWLVAFALVGAQMSWVLRPFIGSPDRPFTWFRPRESQFFEAVIKALRDVFN